VIIADCSEREIVARIQQQLPPAPDWLLVGIGDDAAVVEPERNRVDVLTVDAIVEGVHFDRAFVPPAAIGHRALAVNLSDLAAMGASPRLALLSMALPAALPLADFDAIIGGLTALAREHRVHVVGGNLTRSPGPLMIDVTVSGTVKRRQALTRAGARPGDDLYLSGTIGAASAGLQQLLDVASRRSSVASHEPDVTGRFLYPIPRIRLGLMMSRRRAASACVDLSDGLADAAHRIAESSGVGMTIDEAALPLDPGARAWFESRGADPAIAALTGGDDYELLLAARPRAHRRVSEAARHGCAPIARIGRCTAEPGVMLKRTTGALEPVPQGYGHFRPFDPLRVVASDVERR
jgi:thiamine-monophosphate kinase